MILIINPNSTQAMTDAMLANARAAYPGLTLEGWTSTRGPAAIQGPDDGEAAVPPLLDLIDKAGETGAQAIIIGCFDDTGLAQARARAACPVIGIGQAAYHLAAVAGARFSVVTTLAVSVPIIEGNIAHSGLGGQLGRVRASGVPVLDLETTPDTANPLVRAEIDRAVIEDRVDSVVLGCAGMGAVPGSYPAGPPVPLIDSVLAATGLAAMLIRRPS